MKPYVLALFLYFAENAYFVLTSTDIQNNFANWTLKSARKALNTPIIAETFDTPSLIECASACTWSTKIERVPSFNFEQDLGRCNCNNDLDDIAEDPDEPEVTYGILWLPEAAVDSHYADCNAYYKDGYLHRGFYNIQPLRNGHIFSVFCEMSLNGDDVGWTYILDRKGSANGPEFNRSWTEYVNGFKSDTSFWIGLEFLHHLTKRGSELIIQISYYGDYIALESAYTNFTVGDATSNYTLYVSGFADRFGSGGDSLSTHNGMPFSAPNGDNKCADVCAAGWWYTRGGYLFCGFAILNRFAYGYPHCWIWATSKIHFDNPNLFTIMMIKPYRDDS